MAAPARNEPPETRTRPPALHRRPLGQRKRGRPARISREAIIENAMEILVTTYVDDFMVKTVAEQLGTVPMAIYNYFASREELLEAVADEVCLAFRPPKPKADWRATLLDWLWALKRHADRHPVIHNVIGIDGHVSAGWFRIVAPVVKLLADIGLREKQLALTVYLFVSRAVAMIRVEAAGRGGTAPRSRAHLGRLRPDEQRLIVSLGPPMAALTEKEILDTIFRQLIGSVEQQLSATCPVTHP